MAQGKAPGVSVGIPSDFFSWVCSMDCSRNYSKNSFKDSSRDYFRDSYTDLSSESFKDFFQNSTRVSRRDSSGDHISNPSRDTIKSINFHQTMECIVCKIFASQVHSLSTIPCTTTSQTPTVLSLKLRLLLPTSCKTKLFPSPVTRNFTIRHTTL